MKKKLLLIYALSYLAIVASVLFSLWFAGSSAGIKPPLKWLF